MNKYSVLTSSLVKSKVIKHASLHSELPTKFHPHMIPSSILYVIWGYVRLNYYHLLGSSEFQWFFFIIICSLHALLFLVPQWSIKLKAQFMYKLESDVTKATSILILPTGNNGVGAICPIERLDNELYFYFQKKKYVYNPDRKMFEKLVYVHHQSFPMSHFKKLKGLGTKDLDNLLLRYGPNKFDVPLPTFMELFKEHLVAPFFVFQLFCVALWFLDDMWYFSLFTLVMLFVFESTVVFQVCLG